MKALLPCPTIGRQTEERNEIPHYLFQVVIAKVIEPLLGDFLVFCGDNEPQQGAISGCVLSVLNRGVLIPRLVRAWVRQLGSWAPGCTPLSPPLPFHFPLLMRQAEA